MQVQTFPASQPDADAPQQEPNQAQRRVVSRDAILGSSSFEIAPNQKTFTAAVHQKPKDGARNDHKGLSFGAHREYGNTPERSRPIELTGAGTNREGADDDKSRSSEQTSLS